MPTSRNKNIFSPTLLLMIGAIGISFSPVLVKLLENNALGPTAIGFWRTIIGGVFLFTIAIIMRKKLLLSKWVLFWAAFAGFFFFIDLFAWHRSILYAGSGMATMLGNTQVFGTTILSFLIFKERLTIRFILSALVAMVGVALLVGLWSNEVVFTDKYLLGIFYGLLTGLVYSNYIICLKKAGTQSQKPNIVVMMAWISIISAFFLGIGLIFEDANFMPDGIYSILPLLGLGIFVQALSWLMIANSLSKMDTHRAALILLVQPTLAMVWGYLFFGEALVFSQIAGASITLSAIYVGSIK